MEYLGTAERPAPFGGRGEDIEELDRWLANPDSPRYALLAARSGAGKSSLLSHWVDSLAMRNSPFAVIYHPISARWSTNSRSAVFQSLAFQLATVFGEPTPETEIEQLRETILSYVDRANRDGKPLLIVLDGLDEAAGWQADNTLFPPTRSGSVRIVTAARPLGEGAGRWLHQLGWYTPGTTRVFQLKPLDRSGIADVLLQMGHPLAALGSSSDVVDTLFEKSEGEPLVLSLYVKELRDKHIFTTLEFIGKFQQLEPGLEGFFLDYWLEEQSKLWGDKRRWREPRLRAVLGLCSMAHGALAREDIRALAPERFASFDDVQDTASELSRFVIEIADEHGVGFVLEHRRFEEFVRESDKFLSTDERSDFRQRIVRYGLTVMSELTNGRRKQAPDYVVRWHATHLTESQRPMDDFRPLLDLRWYQECERVDGTTAHFLSDLDQAWKAASGREGLGMRLRITLIRSSLITMGRNIAPELFSLCVYAGVLSPTLGEVIARQQGEKDKRSVFFLVLAACAANDRGRLLGEALEAARQFRFKFEIVRAQLLSAVASCLEGSDRELLRNVLEAACDTRDEQSRAEALSAVTLRMEGADCELLREALDAARDIENESSRVEVLVSVALRAAGSDRELLREALDATHQMRNQQQIIQVQYDALLGVASLLKRGDRELLWKALEAAYGVSHWSHVERRHFERSLWEYGVRALLKEALEVACSIGDWTRAEALLVASRPEGGNRELLREALEAARRIENESSCAKALMVVASRLEASDRQNVLGEALDAARQLKSDQHGVEALSAVASWMEGHDRANILREALEAARQTHYYDRAEALIAVASRMEGNDRANVLREVIEATRQLKDSQGGRTEALNAVARLMDGRDRELLQEVLDAARDLPESWRAKVLSAVASRLEGRDRLNMLREALEVARNVEDEIWLGRRTFRWSRAEALSEVAWWLKGGDQRDVLREALAAARYIGDDAERVEALSGIASRLQGSDRANVLKGALQLGRKVHKWARAEALSAVASRLEGSDRELVQEVLDAARRLEHEWERVKVLGAVVSRLEGSDRELLREVLNAARRIEGKEERVKALSAVVSRLEGSDRLNVFREILDAARRIEDEGKRTEALSAVVSRLEGSDRELLREALDAALGVGDEGKRTEALSAVVSRLERSDRELLRETLDAALRIGDEEERARGLRVVVSRLEGSDQELLQEVLDAARRIGDERKRSEVLSAVASRLEGSDRLNVLREALDAALRIKDEKERARGLSVVVSRLEGSDQELLQEVLDAARRIRYVGSEVVSAVASRLEGSDRLSVLKEALQLAGDSHWFFTRWGAVISQLKGSDRELLREALDAVLRIKHDEERAKGLISVALRLEGSDRELLRKVLDAARRIRDEEKRAEALICVASRLGVSERGNVLREALEAARQIEDDRERTKLLFKVASLQGDASSARRLMLKNLLSVSQDDRLHFLRVLADQWPEYITGVKRSSVDELGLLLEALTREPRGHLLSAIGALAPAIEHAGGGVALHESVSAIFDSARWWK